MFYGDNLEILRNKIKDESVDLCYIDPPFNSKRNYNQIYNNIGSEDKAQAQAFVDTWTWDDEAIKGFDQITSNYNGVFTKQSINLIIGFEKVLEKGSLLAYIISMTLRIVEIQRVLKPTGAFYLHCDPTASHYLKIIIDSIICSKGGDFRSEIIWHRSGGFKRVTAKKFPQKHDVILHYVKSADFFFQTQYKPHKPEYLKRFKPDADGRLRRTDVNPTAGGTRTIYLDDVEGDIIDSVWMDIPPLNPAAKEKLGYPTQKPEALLERIIKSSCPEGGVVLDAYCGCGTSIAVAEKLKRNWIGIDITYQSISLILKRIEKQFSKDVLDKVILSGLPEDFESAKALAEKKDDRTRKEFEKWAVLTYSNNRAIINEKKGGDKGIDGTAFIPDRGTDGSSEFKQILFSVKSDKTLVPSYVRDLYGTMQREGAVMGVLLTLYPPTEGMKKDAKALGKYKSMLFDQEFPKLIIVNASEVISGSRLPISANLEIAVTKSAEKVEDDTIIQSKLF